MAKEMKQAKCIECGKEIMVSKFMSLKKAKCPECKGAKTPEKPREAKEPISLASEPSSGVNAGGNMPKAKENTSPSFGGLKVHPNHGRIDKKPRKQLQRLSCPYDCGEMELLGVIANERWGDIITLQCMNCRTVVEILDASRMRPILRSTDDGIDLKPDKQRIREAFAGGQPDYDRKESTEEEQMNE